jgi:hypothetical protein
MAHESFEDDDVAGYLNDHFVSVKVDREERPDVDAVYMEAVQALTGAGAGRCRCSSTTRAGRSTAAPTGRARPVTGCPRSSTCSRRSSTRGAPAVTR